MNLIQPAPSPSQWFPMMLFYRPSSPSPQKNDSQPWVAGPPGAMWQGLERFWLSQQWDGMLLASVETKDDAKHPTKHRTISHNKTSPGPK